MKKKQQPVVSFTMLYSELKEQRLKREKCFFLVTYNKINQGRRNWP